MFDKEIKIPLPFYFCKECKLFKLTYLTAMADGEPYITVYRCENEEICENVVKNINRAVRSKE